LRLHDFKSVIDYNHVVHKICSKLKFCEKDPIDADKIEKTLSTMLPADRVLQPHHWPNKYTQYSQLIHTLTQAEKHDELLMKTIISTRLVQHLFLRFIVCRVRERKIR
jgi:Co/Zn/Cd efflux system component